MRYLPPLVVLIALAVAQPPFAGATRGEHDRELQAGAPAPGSPQSSAAARERAYRANNVGVAALEQFDYAAAEQSFWEAIELQPDLDIARLNLAIALFYAGDTAGAALQAREAAKRLPDAPQPHYVLGLAARAEGRLDEAIEAFARVLQLDPRDAGARIHLGQIRLQQRQYQEALSLFQEAIAAEPYNVTAAYNAALALTRAGQTEEGRRAMQRFEALRDSAYGVAYSQTYLGQGRYAEAVASTGAEPDLVDRAAPDVTFADATAAFLPDVESGRAARLQEAGATLFDADGDGDLDLLVTGPGALRLFLNEGGRFIEDTARLAAVRAGGAVRAIAGDFDNDERSDLYLLRGDGHALLRQSPDGAFENVTARASLPALSSPPTAAAFADLDHDGDLDIVLAASSIQLLRNNGNGTFTDITEEAGMGLVTGRAIGVAAVDFDNRRDVDIFVAVAGAAPVLFRNMRDGTFRASDDDSGLPSVPSSALTIGDVNKDGYTDVFLGRESEAGLLALSDGQGRFRTRPAPDASRGTVAAQFVDYDNDGLLDLLTATPRGLHLFRNLGGDGWVDITEQAGIGTADGHGLQSLALGDLDGDGDRDILTRLATGELRVWRNNGSKRNGSLVVRLEPRVSNRSALGAKVEIRAGSLHQRLDVVSSTPAVAPADLVFGLGARPAADVVRVLWPSGILQAETSVATTSPQSAEPVVVTELDRKPSSCPYLFTWNGERFEFVTDFMGGGEMGAWLAPAVWNQPDPDEYVRIRGDQLQPRGGRYELRITNELEEAVFLDRVQLLAIDHAADVQVYPNEGLRSPPRPAFTLTSIPGARPPARAVDGRGRDVLPEISSLDRRYPDGSGLLTIRGYAEPHELILDLGAASETAVLLMTGWTDYAFSSDNVAASQGSIAMRPPSLQVKDAQGAWRTVMNEIGFPVGRPQTVVVDLAGRFLSPSREVRILTNMRIYWDQILVSDGRDTAPVHITKLDAASADLAWRGFSHETTPDGREPYGFDYHRVSRTSPWKVMIGRYTREGDVRTLLRHVDDLFVISRPGDEISVSFAALPQVAPGRARTFLLYTHGYSKEMNPRSASPDTVEPLPFGAMTGYPYGADEHYPRNAGHREYRERYNTRVVRRSVPSIDVYGR